METTLHAQHGMKTFLITTLKDFEIINQAKFT